MKFLNWLRGGSASEDEPMPEDEQREAAALESEALEPRIMMSATWADADTGDIIEEASEGDDLFTGDSADDLADGLEGDDVLHGGGGDDTLLGNAGDDQLFGDAGDDTLSGGEGDDTLDGGAGDDLMEGGAGDDTFNAVGAGSGAPGETDSDTIHGGEGVDTVDYTMATEAVTIDLTTGIATTGGSTDTLTSVEGVIGSDYNDTFQFSTPSAGETYSVRGGEGENTIDLTEFSVSDATFDASAGTITIGLEDGGEFAIEYQDVDEVVFAADVSIDTAEISAIQAMEYGDFITLPGEQIAFVTPEQIEELDSGQSYKLATQQAANLTVEQLNAIGHGRVGSIDITQMTVEQLAGLDADTLGDISATQYSAMSAEQVATYTPERIAELDSSDSYEFARRTVEHLTVEQLNAIGHGRVGSIDITQMTVEQLAGLDADTLNDLSATQYSAMSPEQVATFTPHGLQDVSVSGDLAVSEGDTVNLEVDVTLGGGRIGELDSSNSYEFARRTVEDLTPQQLNSIGFGRVGSIDITLMTPEQVGGLDAEHLNDLSSTQFSAMNAEQLATFTPERIGWLDSSSLYELEARQGDNLTQEQAAAVELGTVSDSEQANPNLSYTWTQLSGPGVELEGSGTADPSFIAPDLASDAQASFKVEVSDGITTVTEVVVISITAEDNSPIVDAGEDQVVNEDDEVTLVAVGTDPDNDTLTYTWTQTGGPTVTLTGGDSGSPTFSAPDVGTPVTLTFQVEVSDGENTDIDEVQVEVHDPEVDWVQSLAAKDFDQLDADQAQWLTAEQISGIENKYDFYNMSQEARAALTEDAVQALDTGTISIAYLSEDQRDQLTVEQVQDVGEGSLKYVTADQAEHITPEQIESISNKYNFYNIPSEVRHALDEDAVQAIDTSTISIAYLSEDQRDQLTTEQVESLSYGQFKYLPADRIPELTAEQISSIPNSSTFNQLSSAQRDALTHDQILALDDDLSGISFVGSEGDDALTGNSNINKLIGGAGDDTLDGGGLNDALVGGAGNDELIGGEGDDFIDGGEGTDTATFSGARSDYDITQDEDGNYILSDLREGSPDGTDRVVNVENFHFADGPIPVESLMDSSAADPTLTAEDVSGLEDTPISLDITAALTDLDGSETLSDVTISGVPEGASLSAGTNNHDGSWTVAPGDLAGLTLTPGPNSSSDFLLDVSVTATESSSGEAITTTTTMEVSLTAVADVPSLGLSASGVELNAGGNDGYFGVSDFTLGGQDGFTAEVTFASDQLGSHWTPLMSYATEGSDNEFLVGAETSSGSIMVYLNGQGYNMGVSASEVFDGDPHSISVSFDPDGGELQLFIDGELRKDISGASSGNPPASGGSLVFGQEQDSVGGSFATSQTFSGTLFEARFFNTALDEAAISDNTGQALPATAENLIANWHFDQLEDGIARDAVGEYDLTFDRVAGFTEAESPTLVSGVEAAPQGGADQTITGDGNLQGGGGDDVIIGGTGDDVLCGDASDRSFPIDITAELGDTDGSEVLTVTVDGLPEGATLSSGSANSDGTWTLAADELEGLTATIPASVEDDFELAITATSTESSGVTASTSATLDVRIGEADAAGDDTLVGAGGDDVIDGGQGSDTVVFSGTRADYNITQDDAGNFIVTDLREGSPDGTDTVRNIENFCFSDGDILADSILDSEASTPTLTLGDVQGLEDTAIPLDISASLTDTDGSEILAITIGGVPEGATLSAGTDNGDGTWSIPADALAGLSLTPAANSDTDFTLTVTVTSTESSTGDTATRDGTLAVSVTAVDDSAQLQDDEATITELADDTSTENKVSGNVLTNDIDVDSTLSVAGVALPDSGPELSGTINVSGETEIEGKYGTLTIQPDGSYSYELDDANPTVQALTEGESLGEDFTILIASDSGESATETLTVTVEGTDDAPVSSAGLDQVVDEGTVVTLDGTGSNDPEGTALVYSWVQTSGTPVQLSDASSPTPTFTTPEGLANSDITFELHVTDGDDTTTAQVTITVNADNDAPSANAGVDQTVNELDTVQLSGAGVDPEAQGLTYEWVQVSGTPVVLDDASAAEPTFDAPEGLVNSDIVFELRVSDGVNTSSDTVTVTVNADNDAPAAEAGSFQVVEGGEAVTLRGSGTDPEGQGLSYEWIQTGGPAVSLDGADSPSATFNTPEVSADAELTFELRVSDGTNTSVDTVSVFVDAPETVLSVDAGQDLVVNEGDSVTLSGTSETTTPSISFDVGDVNSYAGSGQDRDGSFEVLDDGATLFMGGNGWKSIDFPYEVTPNTILSFDFRTDTIGEIHGIGFDSDNSIGSNQTFKVAGTQDWGMEVQTYTNSDGDWQRFEIAVGESYTGDFDRIFFVNDHDAGAQDGESYFSNIKVYESDAVSSPTYSWTQVSGPTVILDDASASSPTFEAPEGLTNSDIVFELTVTDGGLTTTDQVTVTVNADNDAPTAEAGPAQTVDEGDTVTLAGSGTDPEGRDLTYAWIQTSGPSVVLDDASAATPTFEAPEGLANSDITFELSVSDGSNTSVDTVTVTVNADNDAPSANAGVDQSVNELDTVQLTGTGVDPEDRGLTYEWVQVSGTPVVLDDASVASPSFDAPEGLVNSDIVFELRVSDGVNTSSDTVTVTVNADNDAPTASAGNNQAAVEGAVVQLNGVGVDPEGKPLSYQWVQTAGPAVVLDDASSASPSFDAPNLLENTDVTFELRVSDGVNTTSDTVTVSIVADNEAPIDVAAGPDQTLDELDLVQLTGSGIDPEGQNLTYEWVQTSGIPVVLSDSSSANPTFEAPEGLVNSDLTFELRVSDGTSVTRDEVTITVRADDDAPSANAGESFQAQEGLFVQLAGSGLDPEGVGLSYEWVQVGGPQVDLGDAHTREPSFLAPDQLKNTDLVFELRVSDGTNTSVDTVTVTIEADDDAPSADAGRPQTPLAGTLVMLGGSGTDPEGQELTYSWTQLEGAPVTLFNADTASPNFVAPDGFGGVLTFEVRVSDGVNTSVDTVTITTIAAPDITTPESPAAQSGSDPDAPQAEDRTPSGFLGGAPGELLQAGNMAKAAGLESTLGELLELGAPPEPIDVDTEFLDLLPPAEQGRSFDEVFGVSGDREQALDATKSLIARDEMSTNTAHAYADDLSQEGLSAGASSEQPTAEQGIMARFFGLVRGLAGTTDRSEAGHVDRKGKDGGRR